MPEYVPTGISADEGSVVLGTSVNFTVTLNQTVAPADGNQTVDITVTSGSSAVSSCPSTVPVLVGNSSAVFPVSTLAGGSTAEPLGISATLSGVSVGTSVPLID